MNKVSIKKDDTVIVLSGDDKGTKGKVLEVSPAERKAIVKGVHTVQKHVKPRKQGENGGIISVEGAIYVDKLALFCDKCGKGVRIKHVVKDGKKIRVCAKCGKEF